MAYHVQLDQFDGPLDLLLFLIRKNEVDLFDIPIANITQQYLDYIEILSDFDLEGASDYILMAATLVRIKAKLLLPKSPVETEEDEEEDPRQELVRQLLEFQRFKEITGTMAELERAKRQLYKRGQFPYEFDDEPETWSLTPEHTLYDLMAVFRNVLMRAPRVKHHRIETISVTTDEQMTYIMKALEDNDDAMLFCEMIEKLQHRLVMIVTFIALLELIRRGLIQVTQSSTLGDIWIKRKVWKTEK